MLILSIFLSMNAWSTNLKFVTQVPRGLLENYRRVTSKEGAPKVTVERCEKKGYSPVFLFTGGNEPKMLYAFGNLGSSLGKKYEFYKKSRSCKRVNMAMIMTPSKVKIARSVMDEYEKLSKQSPKLLMTTIKVCQKKDSAILGVDWSTGYVGGTSYFSMEGKKLGKNSSNDTGNSKKAFDDNKYICDQIFPKK